MTKHIGELPSKSYDRFKCVDKVATQIFDRMPPLEDVHTATHESIEKALEAADPDATDAVEIPRIERRDTPSVMVRTEKLLKSFLSVLDERNLLPRESALSSIFSHDGSTYRPPDFANAPDISYHAANRRAQLPSGIEILRGKPGRPVEDETLFSIREMIEEQEREQAAIRLEEKREFNRRALPFIEPQELFDAPPVSAEMEQQTFANRCMARLQRTFRGEYFLIFTLSGWSTLALMVFIDPGLSTALCFFSLFLLFVSYCLIAEKRK